MYDSDNFLAEYMLLNAGEKVNGFYNTRLAIDTLSKLYFKGKPFLPKWVDGSGLSHYNLVNPTFITELLTDMWKEKGRSILMYFPAGGKQGTVKNWYGNPIGDKPYIYAKTGTLSNVYCLSGYMIGEKGETYAFSIMTNNFMGAATPIRREIQKFLEIMRVR
jgi:D-alanyl-D-alanine carboxypeptidase/D-alanyl-D-alanine-endopeptidase (penicillin-binding protein 4)